MQICVIQMGGTIDKVYPQIPNAYGFEIQRAQSVEILCQWSGYEQFHFHTIAQKDSQDLEQHDLDQLVDYINTTSYDGYLITHGTDTLERTGVYLKDNLLNFTKPMLLTGSRLPACVIGVGVIKSVLVGVYIVLDGSIREVK